MTFMNKELKEVHINFWGSYDLASLSRTVYAAILICKNIKKICILYFHFKDKFVDIFQVWLSKIENKSNCIIKVFCAKSKRKFIFIKLRNFCEKKILLLNM